MPRSEASPRLLRQREMLAFADRVGGKQAEPQLQAVDVRGKSGNLSAAKPQGFPIGENSGLRFDQIREAALSQASGDAAALNQVAQQFRAMRSQLALSRREAALMLGCTEEQILVLENGYGNLATSSELLRRLERLIEKPL